jgi:putative phage-type endonuclease
MDRQEWLEARRKGVGGSDAAAILGLSRWRTAIDVWEDKLGLSTERPQTVRMMWGLRLEDAIAAAYAEETGLRVRRTPGIRKARHVRDFPMIASVDRIASGNGETRLVELKTARSDSAFAPRDGWRDVSPELRVPADYYVQVQHYLEVVDMEVADVAVLFGGSDFRIYEIPRDFDFGADLREEEGRFWRDFVVAEVQPPASADDLAFLARKYPTSVDDEKVGSAEAALLVDRYLSLADGVVELERQRDAVRAEIEETMGSAARLLVPGAVVSWKSHERSSVSWKAYAETLEGALERARLEHPGSRYGLDRVLSDGVGTTDLADVRSLYSATSTVRPFRVDRKEKA